MLGLPRAAVLAASMASGTLLMGVCVAALVGVLRRAGTVDPRRLRTRLFFACLGVVIGAWLFTFGLLTLALGALA